MKKLVVMLVIIAVGAFAAYWPARHHVVETNKGVVVLTKRFLSYTDTFADVRQWSSADFDAHPELKRALISQGYRDMLVELKTREVKATLSNMADRTAEMAHAISAKIQNKVAAWLDEDRGAKVPSSSSSATNHPASASMP